MSDSAKKELSHFDPSSSPEVEQARANLQNTVTSVAQSFLTPDTHPRNIAEDQLNQAIDALIAAVRLEGGQHEQKTDGAALLRVDPSASVNTEALPIDQALTALEFAAGAIIDAIADEDGLDGLAGARVLQMIDAALLANGRKGWPKPTDDTAAEYVAEYSLTAMLRKLTASASPRRSAARKTYYSMS
jgi:hypothetical protein